MKDWNAHKDNIMKELVKLDKLGFSEEANDQVFPYVVIEALNILKNSVFIDSPVDLTKTGEDAKKLLESLK